MEATDTTEITSPGEQAVADLITEVGKLCEFAAGMRITRTMQKALQDKLDQCFKRYQVAGRIPEPFPGIRLKALHVRIKRDEEDELMLLPETAWANDRPLLPRHYPVGLWEEGELYVIYSADDITYTLGYQDKAGEWFYHYYPDGTFSKYNQPSTTWYHQAMVNAESIGLTYEPTVCFYCTGR